MDPQVAGQWLELFQLFGEAFLVPDEDQLNAQRTGRLNGPAHNRRRRPVSAHPVQGDPGGSTGLGQLFFPSALTGRTCRPR